MMAGSSLILIIVLMVLTLTACSRSNQNSQGASSTASASPASPKITSESVVKVGVQGAEISAGGFGDAIVRVTVQSGYHVNSNPPTFPYLKATELDMADTEEISINSIYYPQGLVKKFAFSDTPLHVYEGETPLKVALEAAKTAKKGQQSIPAKLRIQACDDQVCYPPGSIEVVIPVLIK